jgi:endonuclease/exonuclease/phosphatase family metal-dependent hydrolase
VPTMRLLSVNARAYRRDRTALARAIASAGADVVGVHGAADLVRWRQAVAALARESGLVVVTGGGRQSGAALLMSSLRVDVLAVRSVRFAGGSGLHPPGAALAALRLLGSDFVLAAATLAGNSADRLGQAGQLHAALAGLVPARPPAVVGVEGADRPGTAAWQALVENRVALVDRVFVDDRIGVGVVRPLDAPGGPTVVELSLP